MGGRMGGRMGGTCLGCRLGSAVQGFGWKQGLGHAAAFREAHDFGAARRNKGFWRNEGTLKKKRQRKQRAHRGKRQRKGREKEKEKDEEKGEGRTKGKGRTKGRTKGRKKGRRGCKMSQALYAAEDCAPLVILWCFSPPGQSKTSRSFSPPIWPEYPTFFRARKRAFDQFTMASKEPSCA